MKGHGKHENEQNTPSVTNGIQRLLLLMVTYINSMKVNGSSRQTTVGNFSHPRANVQISSPRLCLPASLSDFRRDERYRGDLNRRLAAKIFAHLFLRVVHVWGDAKLIPSVAHYLRRFLTSSCRSPTSVVSPHHFDELPLPVQLFILFLLVGLVRGA